MLFYFHSKLTLKAIFVALLSILFVQNGYTKSTANLTEWLKNYDEIYKQLLHNDMLAHWTYEVNLTDENLNIAMNTSLQLAKFRREKAVEAQKIFNKDEVTDKTLKRALDVIEDVGISISSDEKKLQQISNLTASMLKIYSTACFQVDNKCKKLQPDGLQNIIANSRDYEKLKAVWEGWRNVSGKRMRQDFAKWVRLSNEAIKDGKQYKNLGESWRSAYGPGFVKKIEKLFHEIEELYRLFHAYVRNTLIKKYDAKYFKDNLIPAHILGNMWAQDWANIDQLLLPYKERLDVTGEMVKQGYNASMMFHQAEHFFTSIGLKNMTEKFWNQSVFNKIPERDMVCHASAWDLMETNDFRIKMCTEITMEDFVTIHHEMGHIQYYQQYENQPVYFRNGANPGFHEAVGDTLALSVSTPQHLEKLNLVKNYTDSHEAEINYLMLMALDKLVFVPFAYVMDKFRWGVFSGEISEDEYTAKWWEYKCKYQGIRAPVKRTEDDFDPGAKMHIAGAVPYIRYFVSYVIQFQFHKALCDKIGFKGPLHKCDIYQNKKAGKAFADMLKLGSSVSWEDALEKITGTKKMDASAMLEYFEPLKKWLKNHTDESTIGWSCKNVIKTSPSSTSSKKESFKTLILLGVFYVSVWINF